MNPFESIMTSLTTPPIDVTRNFSTTQIFTTQHPLYYDATNPSTMTSLTLLL